MKKLEFISKIGETYQVYEAALATLSEAQMHAPRTHGEWSIKDVIAHVTWYEREMVGVLRSRTLVGSNLWNMPLEQRNDVIFTENKDHSLADVLAESRKIHREFMELLQDLSDEDLLDASHFREMPLDWLPWQVIASNTCEHYPGHATDILKVFPK